LPGKTFYWIRKKEEMDRKYIFTLNQLGWIEIGLDGIVKEHLKISPASEKPNFITKSK
jgi:hypothetical protein